MHAPSAPRLLSLDALRGADILVIAGLDALVYRLAPLFPQNNFMQGLRAQMGHVAWEGLAAYDLVFPLFVFLAGVSLCLSLQRRAAQSTWRRLGHLWVRAALLVVLGWAINGAITFNPADMRFASVLGLIGFSGASAGTLALLWRGRTWGCVLTAALLLALFHLLLDCCPASARFLTLWAYPFRVAGCNALFVYLFTHLFNLPALAERLSCGLWRTLLPADALPAAYAGSALLLAWLVALWLYRRRLFIHL